MSNARLYVNASNLFVITGSGTDPEVDNKSLNGVPSAGMEYLSYPRDSVSVGLNVTF
jgi:iron complex outermembrane receptor protein